MPWSLVLLLGGGFALAKASTVSGLSAMMGHQLETLGKFRLYVKELGWERHSAEKKFMLDEMFQRNTSKSAIF